MLTALRLQRFKKFEDMEVQLRPFTVLMGENSSGKTTVLQAANFGLTLLGRYGLVYQKDESAHIRGKGVGLPHGVGQRALGFNPDRRGTPVFFG